MNSNDKIAWISEDLCIGCGICVKVRKIAAMLFHTHLQVGSLGGWWISSAHPLRYLRQAWVIGRAGLRGRRARGGCCCCGRALGAAIALPAAPCCNPNNRHVPTHVKPSAEVPL